MRNIRIVMTTVTYTGKHLERLKQIFAPCEFIQLDSDDNDGIAAALKKADVAVLVSDLDERYLNAPQLKWIHCDHGGLNMSAKRDVFNKDLIVTSSAGRSSPALAEHALFFMLALAYHFPAFYEAQKSHVWEIPGQNDFRGIVGRTVGIVGMGHTGSELAIRAKACAMTVLGYRRRTTPVPAGVDVLYCSDVGDALENMIAKCDFLVLALPLSDRTYHLIGERELKMMKSSAYLINLARGAIIDEKALVKAIQNGWIAGAGLDVFEEEPLPSDNPLWDFQNVLITPHVTPQVPDRTARSLDIIEENIRKYRDGEKLTNQLTAEDIYSK